MSEKTKVVLIDPDKPMKMAGCEAVIAARSASAGGIALAVWYAMLAAAPEPAQSDGETPSDERIKKLLSGASTFFHFGILEGELITAWDELAAAKSQIADLKRDYGLMALCAEQKRSQLLNCETALHDAYSAKEKAKSELAAANVMLEKCNSAFIVKIESELATANKRLQMAEVQNERLLDELAAAKAEIERILQAALSDPISRLNNVCAALEEHKNDSPYSAEAWEAADNDNKALRVKFATATKRLQMAKAQNERLDGELAAAKADLLDIQSEIVSAQSSWVMEKERAEKAEARIAELENERAAANAFQVRLGEQDGTKFARLETNGPRYRIAAPNEGQPSIAVCECPKDDPHYFDCPEAVQPSTSSNAAGQDCPLIPDSIVADSNDNKHSVPAATHCKHDVYTTEDECIFCDYERKHANKSNAAGQAMTGHQEGVPTRDLDTQLPVPAAPLSDADIDLFRQIILSHQVMLLPIISLLCDQAKLANKLLLELAKLQESHQGVPQHAPYFPVYTTK